MLSLEIFIILKTIAVKSLPWLCTTLNKLKVIGFFFFFWNFKSSLQKASNAGTRFALLFQSRNKIGRLMKTYSHKPIEILYFLLSGDFRRFSNNFKIGLHFQSPASLSRAYNKWFCYMLFLFMLHVVPVTCCSISFLLTESS